MTFWNVPNYGAMLQAYALNEYLSQRGHEVCFIDCPYICKPKYPFWRILASRSLLGVKLKIKHNLAREDMCGFVKRLNATKAYKSYQALTANPPDFDVYIVGSDQMWNPAWCLKELDTVFLNFGSARAKRVAYAVSLGATSWPENALPKLKQLLNNFSALSVREQSGADLIKRISGKESVVLPDPTLLFDADFYQKLCGSDGDTHERYIFRYALDWDQGKVAKVYEIVADDLEVKLVRTQYRNDFSSLTRRVFKIKKQISVTEWLYSFANAEFVVTDSFHGTVLAIINHKPFITTLIGKAHKLEGMNERIVSLLRFLGLEDRMVEKLDPIKIRTAIRSRINWSAVDLRISAWRKEADVFLEKIDCHPFVEVR
jgi:hypothetical protein